MKNRPFIILSVLVVVVSSLWLLEPIIFQTLFVSTEITEKMKGHEIVNIAHRGASGHAPENTIPAIELAIEMGADMIAIDVHVTKDGEVVVLHDELLDRTTNGTGNVHEMTLADLQELDAGSWFSPEFAGEKIPTLDEALKHINGRAKCLIEMKSKGAVFYEGFAKLVVDVIEDNNAVEWSILESYDEHYLDEAHEYDPRVQIKQILIGEDNTNVFSYFIRTRNLMNTRQKHKYLSAVNPPFHALSERRVYELHSRRLQVFTFLVNEREDLIKVLNMGVDGVITNYPDRLHDIKEEIEAL
ncbi:MAG: glycerophosphodiester phosphodiesterase family protein [Cyclobacteriaceae bacterium]